MTMRQFVFNITIASLFAYGATYVVMMLLLSLFGSFMMPYPGKPPDLLSLIMTTLSGSFIPSVYWLCAH